MPESNPNPIAENKPKSSSVENVRASKSPKKENSPFSEKLQQVGENIRKGYRIMVLMRGLPGSGKTYTAQSIVNKFVELRPPFTKCGDFIFSTDDYFYNSKGVYKYNVKRLSEAHNFNQKRVRDMAVIGFSPIIVDNTNLKMWEMEPYVKFAVENRYIIEVIEPTPPWNKCAYTLAERNIHGVPLEKIWVMMDKYEKGDVSEFLKVALKMYYEYKVNFSSVEKTAKNVTIRASLIQYETA